MHAGANACRRPAKSMPNIRWFRPTTKNTTRLPNTSTDRRRSGHLAGHGRRPGWTDWRRARQDQQLWNRRQHLRCILVSDNGYRHNEFQPGSWHDATAPRCEMVGLAGRHSRPHDRQRTGDPKRVNFRRAMLLTTTSCQRLSIGPGAIQVCSQNIDGVSLAHTWRA